MLVKTNGCCTFLRKWGKNSCKSRVIYNRSSRFSGNDQNKRFRFIRPSKPLTNSNFWSSQKLEHDFDNITKTKPSNTRISEISEYLPGKGSRGAMNCNNVRVRSVHLFYIGLVPLACSIAMFLVRLLFSTSLKHC